MTSRWVSNDRRGRRRFAACAAIALFGMCGAAEANDFTAAPSSPEAAGSEPYSVAVGDFDGDGNKDLATANSSSNDVTVLLGDGSGDFSAAGTGPEATGSAPVAVAVGDFNGDGKQDLATANTGSDNVTILLGDGSGDFTAALSGPVAVVSSPFSVTVGDFNGDGKQDLATAHYQASDNLTILLGDGSGDFSATPTSPMTVGSFPSSVTVGDFNGDGKQDLATANTGSDNVTILLGDGIGGFSPSGTSPEAVGDGPASVAVGDFNGDGKQDLAVASYDDGTVSILIGDGSGDFIAAASSLSQNPVSITVGDFNDDGKQDLATANPSHGTVTILLGDGSGAFTAAPTSPETVGNFPYSVAVGDFNGDGKGDLATANTFSNDVTVLLAEDVAPTAVNDSATVSEDASATTIDVLANDTDTDAGRKTIASKTDGTHGTVVITNSGADLTYAPDAGYCGSDSFTYTLNGGSVGTVSITVTCGPPERQCVDGLDNDSDGKVDFPDDPGCAGAQDDSESPDPTDPRACTIRGTAGDDIIHATAGDDVICARGGNDTVYGRGGDDVISGGDDDDVIRGAGGDDSIRGRGGNDRLYGGLGQDFLRGEAGDDYLSGADGGDQLLGGAADDRLTGGSGDDTLFGRHGDDALNTRDEVEGNDSASGGAGEDTCAADRRDARASC